jgi:hypothetical protein
VLSGSSDGTLKLWDLGMQRCVQVSALLSYCCRTAVLLHCCTVVLLHCAATRMLHCWQHVIATALLHSHDALLAAWT